VTLADLEARVLTVPEAAALLRVSTRTYYAAAARGEVPCTRIGRRIVVSGSALVRLLGSPSSSFPLEDRETAAYLFHDQQRGGD
jgi:excisionase family DNA binding protein